MKYLRNKKTAVKCCFLTKAITAEENSISAPASFACINTVFFDDNSKYNNKDCIRIIFDSLDFCCTCEDFSKEYPIKYT